MRAFYGADLAYIHDVGYTDFINRAAPNVLTLLRAAGVRSGRVVDLGCGAGQLVRALSRAGYDAWGVDQSAAMIARARKRAPRARFVHGSFASTPLPPCDAVTALGEPVSYLGSRQRALSVLRRVFRALRPGGVLVFDMREPTGQHQTKPLRGRIGRDWAILGNAEEDPQAHRLTRRIVLFRRAGKTTYRRTQEVHRLCVYKAAEIRQWLRAIGFRVRVVRRYGTFRLPEGLAGFLARKPLV